MLLSRSRRERAGGPTVAKPWKRSRECLPPAVTVFQSHSVTPWRSVYECREKSAAGKQLTRKNGSCATDRAVILLGQCVLVGIQASSPLENAVTIATYNVAK